MQFPQLLARHNIPFLDVHVVDVAVDVVDAEDADVDVDVLFCR